MFLNKNCSINTERSFNPNHFFDIRHTRFVRKKLPSLTTWVLTACYTWDFVGYGLCLGLVYFFYCFTSKLHAIDCNCQFHLFCSLKIFGFFNFVGMFRNVVEPLRALWAMANC